MPSCWLRRLATLQTDPGGPPAWLLAAWYGGLTFLVVFALHFLMFHNGPNDPGFQLALQTRAHVITLTAHRCNTASFRITFRS